MSINSSEPEAKPKEQQAFELSTLEPRHPKAQTSRQPRLVLIDDDPLFSHVMERVAESASISLVSVPNCDAVDQVGLDDFDAAIIDFDLGNVTGPELAEYLAERVGRMPVVMISYKSRFPSLDEPWPSVIQYFVHKGAGPQAILSHALSVLKSKARLRSGVMEPWRFKNGVSPLC